MSEEMDMEMMQPQMPSQGNMLQRILGGMAAGKAQQEGGYQYGDYVGINDTYKGINDTYVPMKYQKKEYTPVNYETPPYDSMGDELFGPARGQPFQESKSLNPTGVGANIWNSEPSPALQYTGMHENLFQGGLEESPLFKPSGVGDELLFGVKPGQQNGQQNNEQNPGQERAMQGSLEESPLFKPTGVADELLFGVKTPAFTAQTEGEIPTSMPNPNSMPMPATYNSPVFGPGLSEPTGKGLLLGPELQPKGYRPPVYAPAAPAVVTPYVPPTPVAPPVQTVPTEVGESVEEEPIEEGGTEEVTPVTPPVRTSQYIPQPVVRPRTQMEGKRLVGRPRLSDEEKARRKADREASRQTGITEMQ